MVIPVKQIFEHETVVLTHHDMYVLFHGRKRAGKGVFKFFKNDVFGDWTDENGEDRFVRIYDILHLINEHSRKELELKDIAWEGKAEGLINENCPCCGGKKMKNPDLRFPPIVMVNGPENPLGLPYRTLDGKHRCQTAVDRGIKKGFFYVVDYNDIKDLFVQKVWEF